MKKVRISFNSPVVLGFISICVLVTFLGFLSSGKITDFLFTTYHSSPKNLLTYVRFFTHIFGHRDWDHLLKNCVYLLLLGPMLEEKYGSKQIFKTIALTAVVTAFINYNFFDEVSLSGASGVVFAFILLASVTEFKEGEIPVTFIMITLIFVGGEIYKGITIDDNVSNMSHIAGGLIGGATGYMTNRMPKEEKKE